MNKVRSLVNYNYAGNIYDAAAAGSTTFALTSSAGNPIIYLQRAHIHVYTSNDDGQNWIELIRPANWDFDTTGTSVVLSNGIAEGEWVRVLRITPVLNRFVDFADGSLVTAAQLNQGEDYSRLCDQELSDGLASTTVIANTFWRRDSINSVLSPRTDGDSVEVGGELKIEESAHFEPTRPDKGTSIEDGQVWVRIQAGEAPSETVSGGVFAGQVMSVSSSSTNPSTTSIFEGFSTNLAKRTFDVKANGDFMSQGSLSLGNRDLNIADTSGTAMQPNGLYIQRPSTDLDTAKVIRYTRGRLSGGTDAEGDRFTVLADGDVDTKGVITTAGDDGSGKGGQIICGGVFASGSTQSSGVTLYGQGVSTQGRIAVQAKSGTTRSQPVMQALYGNSVVYKLDYNGNSALKDVLLELEADNPNAWETREEEYEQDITDPDGNDLGTVTRTREIKEYKGKVLSVSEELQDLRKRALEHDAVIKQMTAALRSQGVQIDVDLK